jgi:hypothetical protein
MRHYTTSCLHSRLLLWVSLKYRKAIGADGKALINEGFLAPVKLARIQDRPFSRCGCGAQTGESRAKVKAAGCRDTRHDQDRAAGVRFAGLRAADPVSVLVGLPGFIMRSTYNAAYPTQGTRQGHRANPPIEVQFPHFPHRQGNCI